MENVNVPKTEIELENWMKENCFNFNSYSINGNHIYEGYGIEKSGGSYIWYYTERGQKDNLRYFTSEADIVEFAFDKIKSDKWAKTHCIGFSTDINKINELKNILRTKETTFFEDKIPYYGLERPVYRVFVLGCDIKKTEYLKDVFWTEK